MDYTGEQVNDEKHKSFQKGRERSRVSTETQLLLREQTDEFKKILATHERVEEDNYKELFLNIQTVTDLVKKHIEETAVTDKTMRDLIIGSRVARGWFYAIVAIVGGIGVLTASIMALKDWIKK